MPFEREFPARPWVEYATDPEKAKLEEAIHRTEAAKHYARERQGKVRCGECGRWEVLVQEGECWASRWGTGRRQYRARCQGCGEVSLRSYHPAPVEVPGLA